MAVVINARGTSVSSFQIGKGGVTLTADAAGYITIADGSSTQQPLGFNTIPIYEIDANDIFDVAHAGMMWHKDANAAITFTCDNVSSIPQGSSWAVHNDDAENLTIAEGAGVTINFLTAGSAPVTGNVTVEQGGIVTVYKYTDTEYWVWGDKELFVQAAATVITVADTADTTTFPVLVGNATGDEIPLTDGGLTYNASTGNLSATQHGGIVEANLLDKTASETVSGAYTHSADITMSSADIQMADNLIVRPEIDDYSITSTTQVITSNTATLTYSTAQSYELDLEAATGNVTVTLSGGPPSGTYGEMIVKVQQDTTAARTITWAGGTFGWPAGTAPTQTATADAIDIYHFSTWNSGTNWWGTVVQDMS